MYSEAYKQAVSRAKIPYKEGRKQFKIQCSGCGALSDIREKIAVTTAKGKIKAVVAYQVDHIAECGSLNCFADMGSFTEKLFTGRQEVLCYNCHQTKHRTIPE